MKRRGVQILEEALLIIVALMAIAVTIGALGQVQAKIDEIVQKTWEGLDWLFRTIFYFLPR
jgi:hypothetical protein